LKHSYAELILVQIPTPVHHPLVVLVEVVPSHGEVVAVVAVQVLVEMVVEVVVAKTIEAKPMDRLT
jgi:hypothetical protein